MELENLKLAHPFCAVLFGATRSGKTTFLRQLCKNVHQYTRYQPDYIIWFGKYTSELFYNRELMAMKNLIIRTIQSDDLMGEKCVAELIEDQLSRQDMLGKSVLLILDDLQVN
jgi:GTPase SAR1 family protein